MDTLSPHSIVVGLDGSPHSDAALDWAVLEAGRRTLPLHLFSAGMRLVPSREAMYDDGRLAAEVTREALDAARGVLATARERAGRLAPGLAVTTEAAADHAAGRLVELSARADSVVLGRSGHGSVIGALVGSVSLQVASHADCPVVVVHEPEGTVESRHGVVVGVDGSAVSALALGYAFEQASRRGVPLHAVHAWWTTVTTGDLRHTRSDMDTQQRLTLSETMVGWSEKFPDVEVHESLPVGAAVPALTEAAGTAELLVVGSRGRGGFRRLLLGSVSHGVLQHAPCTVAVVRPRSKASHA